MTHKLFVYGTLKPEYSGNAYFSSKPVAAVTQDKFIVGGTSYPRAVIASSLPHLSGYASRLFGYVYDINDKELSSADWYEGYPSYYKRTKINVVLYETEEIIPAIIYEANEAADIFNHLTLGMDKELEENLAVALIRMPSLSFQGDKVVNW